ncbi:hypothetical protein LIER_31012 [Lithospermum erythrorhizon]|uniref:ZF-HD dimerization-type domain-containing protein n=1 Tax=Lithospermum erythrorhizon TaxID=34254 RepID=A0AAV3RT88_LITER
MDLTTPTKSADSESDTPPHVQPINSLSFTNGAIKNHHEDHHHHNHQRPPPPPVVVTYKECLKNHAASIGGHAMDGCLEFMPSSSTSLKCAACGCHRNFHRREPDECCSSPTPISSNNPTTHFLDFKLHHVFHHSRKLSPTTPTALKGENNASGRKRFRTKFTQNQKEKMLCFAEKLNWKMPKNDEYAIVKDFCNEVGLTRGVLKVWMHNNKHTIGRKKSNNNNLSMNNNGSSPSSY